MIEVTKELSLMVDLMSNERESGISSVCLSTILKLQALLANPFKMESALSSCAVRSGGPLSVPVVLPRITGKSARVSVDDFPQESMFTLPRPAS